MKLIFSSPFTSLLSSFPLLSLISSISLSQYSALKGATDSGITRNYDNNYDMPCIAVPAGHIPSALFNTDLEAPSGAGRVVAGPDGAVNMTLT